MSTIGDDITIYEGENKGLPYTLTYSNDATWSQGNKRGTPVLQADVTRLYFTVSAFPSDDSNIFIQATDANDATPNSWIEWISPTAGTIVVHFGIETLNHQGRKYQYQLFASMADGSEIMFEAGKFTILPSAINIV